VASGSDHYGVLGVPPNASAAEIRQAYLRLAREHHPDRHLGAPAPVRTRHEKAMREVNAAWAVLGDVQRRRRYDDQRAEAAAGDTPRGASRGSTAREQRWAAEDAAKAAWRPFDDGPDDIDQRLRSDEPPPVHVPGPPLTLDLRFFVKLCFGLGAGFFLGGALSGAARVSGAGIVMMTLAAAGLVAVPLLALGRSAGNDKAADRRRAQARTPARARARARARAGRRNGPDGSRGGTRR
jgi:hypothetical protein